MLKSSVCITFVLLFCCFRLYGQNNGLLSQYMFNKLIINPAYAGEEGALALNFLHKDQWSSVEGAPSTQMLSAHSPFTQKNSLGLILVRDRMGNLDQQGIYGSYAYRIHFETGSLSLGLQAGLTAYRTGDYLSVRDEGDPVFTEDINGTAEPNFGAGAFYSNDRFYAGFSSPQLFKWQNQENISFALQRKSYLFHGGYSITVNDDFLINPSVLVHFKSNYKPEVNLNINMLMKNLVWVGVLYRNFNSIGVLSKIHVNQRFHLGYGYDFNTGPLRSLSEGSHELMLFYTFRYVKEKIKSPRFF